MGLFLLSWFGLALMPVGANADWEYQIDGLYRSYPLSGAVEFTSAYGSLLWGTEGGADSPWFGYVKPQLRYTTAWSYNALAGEVILAPISFLTLAAGVEGESNTKDYRAFDCIDFICRGRFWRTYEELRLVLGYGPAILMARGRLDHLHQDASQEDDFIEPGAGLAANVEGDHMTTIAAAFGWKLDETWSVFYSYTGAKLKSDKSQSRQNVVLLSWGSDPWRISGGGGYFDSELKARNKTVVVMITWKPTPRMGF